MNAPAVPAADTNKKTETPWWNLNSRFAWKNLHGPILLGLLAIGPLATTWWIIGWFRDLIVSVFSPILDKLGPAGHWYIALPAAILLFWCIGKTTEMRLIRYVKHKFDEKMAKLPVLGVIFEVFGFLTEWVNGMVRGKKPGGVPIYVKYESGALREGMLTGSRLIQLPGESEPKLYAAVYFLLPPAPNHGVTEFYPVSMILAPEYDVTEMLKIQISMGFKHGHVADFPELPKLTLFPNPEQKPETDEVSGALAAA